MGISVDVYQSFLNFLFAFSVVQLSKAILAVVDVGDKVQYENMNYFDLFFTVINDFFKLIYSSILYFKKPPKDPQEGTGNHHFPPYINKLLKWLLILKAYLKLVLYGVGQIIGICLLFAKQYDPFSSDGTKTLRELLKKNLTFTILTAVFLVLILIFYMIKELKVVKNAKEKLYSKLKQNFADNAPTETKSVVSKVKTFASCLVFLDYLPYRKMENAVEPEINSLSFSPSAGYSKSLVRHTVSHGFQIKGTENSKDLLYFNLAEGSSPSLFFFDLWTLIVGIFELAFKDLSQHKVTLHGKAGSSSKFGVMSMSTNSDPESFQADTSSVDIATRLFGPPNTDKY